LTERRDIGSRLENWARVYQDRPRQGISPTAAYCDQLRREAEGDTSASPERRKIDEDDAHAIERGMRELDTKHRLILWWCYIRGAPMEVVCRKVSIAHRPATIFINLFRDAQRAIESVVEKNMEHWNGRELRG
jgi:DNA-directed RNA polymerase specialized sigma24 family protein